MVTNLDGECVDDAGTASGRDRRPTLIAFTSSQGVCSAHLRFINAHLSQVCLG
ncbi:hypothetical protein Fuma_04877 [Fuerstiella marisgermanici]|uniref:Uncharacterized protein n=1 Tax=Fuerstiella marisgermanici TaxID=1891926 RepID=A0A1P8WMG3_9PLAN|nr:hypothetical protein Fuma_04877 [Fuerstiella marisgermanici]